ncbi:hypothetical protein ATKI12_8463 [Kitasatospora sp. Ki12]|uniref:hypothetical protein n=1 Tax=Kitasatospora xanthocidica TaxID=83382 RepID=UPI001674AAC2|nr:hypothetical protein [Kitasatospora xanthocidica]GHF76348.1 hypothetical protein GCM10018790_62890 [Kitasatospora xanthocidica]
MKKTTTGLAVLGLAAAGVVGLGAGTAHADPPLCSTWGGSRYGAPYQVCVTYSGPQDALIHWTVNASRTSTDERFWLRVASACGDRLDTDWNDYQDNGMNVGDAWVHCASGGFEASLYPTESGLRDGPVVRAG